MARLFKIAHQEDRFLQKYNQVLVAVDPRLLTIEWRLLIPRLLRLERT